MKTGAGVLHVACASDAPYLFYCATMLSTLFRQTAGRPVVVHHLCPRDYAPENRAVLARLAERHGQSIEFHVVDDDKVAGLPPMRNVPRLAWYRLFLPELLPHLERVLYLDCDLIVVDRIEPVWETDLAGRPLAAVRNVTEPQTLQRLLPALGLPADAPYFNTGVLLLDLRAIRDGRWFERVLEFARANAPRLFWGDQDAMNAVLSGAYQPLHPRWNCMNSLFYFRYARDVHGDAAVEEALRRPAILHFEGPDDVKPWNARSRHPRRAEYLRHLRAAVWSLDLPASTRLAYAGWYGLPMPVRRLMAAVRARLR